MAFYLGRRQKKPIFIIQILREKIESSLSRHIFTNGVTKNKMVTKKSSDNIFFCEPMHNRNWMNPLSKVIKLENSDMLYYE